MPQKPHQLLQSKPFALAFLALSIITISYLMIAGGVAIVALIVLPISFIAWHQGRWMGLLAGALSGPALYQMTMLNGGPIDFFSAQGFGPGLLPLVSLGFVVGYANEQTRISRRAVAEAELALDLVTTVAADLCLEATLNEITLRVERELAGGRCSILLLKRNSGTLHHASAPSLPAAYCQLIDGISIGPKAGSCGTAAFRNEMVIVEDVQQCSLWEDFKDIAREHNLVACWSMPIRDARGDVVGTFATYHDQPGAPSAEAIKIVTEASANVQIVVAREKARALNTELEDQVQTAQKLEGLGLLAGGIAHDFNNMLAVVLGNAELLALQTSDKEQYKKVQAITNSATRAAELANKMLAYAGKANQQLASVNLSSLVEDIVPLASAGIPKTIRLDMDLVDELPALLADATQLRQILMNLLRNAAESIGDQRPGTISIRTNYGAVTRETLDKALLGESLPPGCYICLEVKDDGEGIPVEQQQQVFDPFFTTKFAGRGLGLSVIYGVMKRHSGAIVLDSKPGSGTRFALYFPVQDHEVVAGTVEDAATEVSGNSGVALIIDDEEHVREVTKEYLKHLGFDDIHMAECGREGLELYGQLADKLSLMLVDFTMPDMNGREVLTAVESIPSAARHILMTGYEAANVRNSAMHLTNPILHKPFNLQALSTAISEAGELRDKNG